MSSSGRKIPWIWTVDEIQMLGEFGADHGWFYGFVWHEGRLHAGEIYPGMGFTQDWPHPWWDVRSWWRAARDVVFAKARLS